MKQYQFFKLYTFAFVAILFAACSESGTSAEASRNTFDATVVCPSEGFNRYNEPNRGTFTDIRDGQVYKYTTIGTQVWMAENLRYGEEIPCAEESCSVKGRIYMFSDTKEACPAGWHLPSLEEWQQLFSNMGGVEIAGQRLKSASGWLPLNAGQSANGSDDCGFEILPIPGTGIGRTNGTKKRDGYVALIWTSTVLQDDFEMLGVAFQSQTTDVKSMHYFNGSFLSVRCLKD